jgi:hypothetical protein
VRTCAHRDECSYMSEDLCLYCVSKKNPSGRILLPVHQNWPQSEEMEIRFSACVQKRNPRLQHNTNPCRDQQLLSPLAAPPRENSTGKMPIKNLISYMDASLGYKVGRPPMDPALDSTIRVGHKLDWSQPDSTG